MKVLFGIFTFIAGLAGGAAVATLTTPHSGKTTRSRLKARYNREREKFNDKKEELSNRMRNKSNKQAATQ